MAAMNIEINAKVITDTIFTRLYLRDECCGESCGSNVIKKKSDRISLDSRR